VYWVTVSSASTAFDTLGKVVYSVTDSSGTDFVHYPTTVEVVEFIASDIEAQTDDIGVAGAGLTDLGGMSTGMKAEVESEVDDSIGGGTGTALTAIPWNASWDAEVQSEVVDGLTAEGYSSTRAGYLDELAAANLPADIAAIPTTDYTTTINAIYDDTNILQVEWADGGRLDLIQDIIAADTTTDIPALIATAQADLDNPTQYMADVSGIPTTDYTTTVNLIYADTNELQTNQGAWATATGFMPDSEDGSSFTVIIGADGDTLETLSDQLDTVSTASGGDATEAKQDAIIASLVTAQADLDTPNQYKADVSGIPTTDYTTTVNLIYADTNEIQGKLPTGYIMGSSDVSNKDDEIDAIKAKTDNLPADPADDSDIDAQLLAIDNYIDTEIASILADTNEVQSDLTDGGRLDNIIDELTTQGDTNETKLDTIDNFVDTEVASILADTNELQTNYTPTRAGYLDYLANGTYGLSALDTDLGTILTKIGAYDDTATMEGSLFAGQQAIYNDASGIGSGTNTVTIQINDDGGSGLANAKVYVYDSGNSTKLFSLLTGSSPAGRATIYLDDATYKLRNYKVGYTANTLPESLTVSGDTTGTFVMNAQSSGTPTSVDVCRISIDVFTQTGDSYSYQTVTAKFVEFSSGGNIDDSGAVVANISETKEVDSDGIVWFDLPRASNATFTFNLPEDRFTLERVIPDEATKDFEDLVAP
jgi:hypothetical protein